VFCLLLIATVRTSFRLEKAFFLQQFIFCCTRCYSSNFSTYTVKHKSTPNVLPQLKEGLSNFNIFDTHIRDTPGHQMAFSFPPHPTSAFALPGKTEQKKCALKSTKNFIKFHLSGYVAINGQSITRFDCFVAVRLLNRPNIQEYWWIQEATGEVWIGLKQNVIDAAINEWRKCLRAVPMFVGQHFKHFCRQLKMDD